MNITWYDNSRKILASRIGIVPPYQISDRYGSRPTCPTASDPTVSFLRKCLGYTQASHRCFLVGLVMAVIEVLI